MRRSEILLLGALSLILCSCQLIPTSWGNGGIAPAVLPNTTPQTSESVLYARDGSVVDSAGAQSDSNMPRREVQNGDGTRIKILELYERVVAERDQLRLTLAARDSELAQARHQLATESARANDFEARMRSADHSNIELANQNLDLAGRLTTAQIRRLEAEKKWLEMSISVPNKTVAGVENAPESMVKNTIKASTEPVQHQ